MNAFYYIRIAPIICWIFGHKWTGKSRYFLGGGEIGVRRFNRSRKGGKRRPQMYRKSRKYTFDYCTRCGKVMTKKERRKHRK